MARRLVKGVRTDGETVYREAPPLPAKSKKRGRQRGYYSEADNPSNGWDCGVYSPDGYGGWQKIGSTCGCEDYPCCGH